MRQSVIMINGDRSKEKSTYRSLGWISPANNSFLADWYGGLELYDEEPVCGQSSWSMET
jgi:hypothetical protein